MIWFSNASHLSPNIRKHSPPLRSSRVWRRPIHSWTSKMWGPEWSKWATYLEGLVITPARDWDVQSYTCMYIVYIYIYVVIYIDVKNYGCQWEWIKMAGHPILVELHASQHTTTWRILCGSNFGWCFWVVMLPKLLWSTQFCQPKKNIQKQPTMQQKQPTTTWHHHRHILSDLPSLARLFFHKSSPFKHTSMYIYIYTIYTPAFYGYGLLLQT